MNVSKQHVERTGSSLTITYVFTICNAAQPIDSERCARALAVCKIVVEFLFATKAALFVMQKVCEFQRLYFNQLDIKQFTIQSRSEQADPIASLDLVRNLKSTPQIAELEEIFEKAQTVITTFFNRNPNLLSQLNVKYLTRKLYDPSLD